MKFLPKWTLCFLFCMMAAAALAQESPQDSSSVQVDSLETEEINVVDIVIQRGLMTGTSNISDLDTTTSIKNSSGTWFVGLGFKIPVLKNKAGFRLTPGIAWTKLNYDSVNYEKSFPDLLNSDSIDYTFQKHRLTYFQIPLGMYVNFSTDEKGRPKIFGEAGGYIGYSIGGVLRYGERSVRDQQIRTKISNIPDRNNLQYGIYGRLGYKSLAFYGQYRIPNLFTTYKTEVIGGQTVNTTTLNPRFPKFEFGLSLLL